MNCIDVSSNNRVTDFAKVRAAGIETVIIRTIVKSGAVDPKAEQYFRAVQEAGLGADAYKYSYALTMGEERAAMNRVIALLRTLDINPAQTTMWDDYEWITQRQRLTRQEITDLVKTAQETILDAGYKFGVYCNLDWYLNVLLPDQLSCPWWIARYPASDDGTIRESLRPNVGEMIWQYSSKGHVDGISGYVDLNDRKAEAATYLPSKPAEIEPGVIWCVSIADVSTEEAARIVAARYPGCKVHHAAVLDAGSIEIWIASIADVWTQTQAEAARGQFTALGIAGKVHKIQIL